MCSILGETGRDRAQGCAFVVATVEVPDDLGIPVVNGYRLLYEDDPDVLAEFDALVARLTNPS